MACPVVTPPLPQDLRNLSFLGMNCAGWDFSGRDIRGCDFRNAKLNGANFSGSIAGTNQKRQFKTVIVMTLAFITGLGLGSFLVGVSASIASTVAFLFWKKRPIVFDFALTGIYWGAFLAASIKIINSLSNGRTAYAIGLASIAFLAMAFLWTYETKKTFRYRSGTTFKNANLEGANFSEAVLDDCNFDKANLNNVTFSKPIGRPPIQN